jgi:hypothetical protein
MESVENWDIGNKQWYKIDGSWIIRVGIEQYGTREWKHKFLIFNKSIAIW